MSLQIGIVGLPNVGKSTLFTALTKKQVDISNYPFCTINPNVGVVKVPDQRLEQVAQITKPKKIIPTMIEFIDIAGLVRDAHQGQGLGNQFLSQIRECDAICEVVRDFRDEQVIHVSGKVDPDSDRQTIDLELVFADLETVEKRLNKITSQAKSGDKKLLILKNLFEKLKTHLESGQPIRSLVLIDEEKERIKDLNLLTLKPIIYLLNIGQDATVDFPHWQAKVIKINAQLEAELASLSEPEQKEYLQELDIKQSGLDKLIKASYELLNLVTFFTIQSGIVQAWTVKQGRAAPAAAAVIHTDFAKGFIRAEVINCQKFIEAGGEVRARELGWIRTEGKDYVMQDGDVVNFLFSN